MYVGQEKVQATDGISHTRVFGFRLLSKCRQVCRRERRLEGTSGSRVLGSTPFSLFRPPRRRRAQFPQAGQPILLRVYAGAEEVA